MDRNRFRYMPGLDVPRIERDPPCLASRVPHAALVLRPDSFASATLPPSSCGGARRRQGPADILRHLAALENDDAAGGADGLRPMRDDDARHAGGPDGVVDRLLAPDIQVARRLVQEEN